MHGICTKIQTYPQTFILQVSLSISILLSLTVFFLLLAEIIPSTSMSVPLLGNCATCSELIKINVLQNKFNFFKVHSGVIPFELKSEQRNINFTCFFCIYFREIPFVHHDSGHVLGSCNYRRAKRKFSDTCYTQGKHGVDLRMINKRTIKILNE